MTMETFERTKEANLHFLSEVERACKAGLALSLSSNRYSVYIDKELGEKLIPLIREYYEEQAKNCKRS